MTKMTWWISTIFWIIMFVIGFTYLSNPLLKIGLFILLIIIAGLQITLWKLMNK